MKLARQSSEFRFVDVLRRRDKLGADISLAGTAAELSPG
jgi:hypothetical protein